MNKTHKTTTALLAGAFSCIAPTQAATVLYHRFDGDAGVANGATATNIADSSAGGNGSSSIAGAPVYSNGVPTPTVPQTGASNGFSLDLERSSSQRYAVADNNNLDFGAGSAFTLEGYVKLETLSSATDSLTRQYLFLKKSGANADSALNYSFIVSTANIIGGDGSGRQLALQLGDGSGFSTVFSSFKITDNDWHYVGVRFNDVTDAVRFTLDGNHEDTTSTQAIAANGLDLTIGGHMSSSGAFDATFDGQIDELRISNTFLADSALLNVLEPSSALLSGLGALGLLLRRRRS